MLSISFIIISVLYVFAIWFLIIGLIRIVPKSRITSDKLKKISVIVAARNEESNVCNLLESLENQTYPKDLFEVIIVDDRSFDNTNELINKYQTSSQLNIKLLQLEDKGKRNGKKYAIAKGIEHAQYDILLFTDSDCIVNPKWVETFSKAYDDDTDYVLAYTHVKFTKNNLFNRLKTLEAILYRVIAASGLGNGTAITASASNMSYRKSCFIKANGFGRYKNIKSGDDDLQLFNLWVHLRKKKYLFTPDASVTTMEKESLESHVNLDTRRASKFKYFPLALKLFCVLVFFYYIYFIVFSGWLVFNLTFLKLFLIMLGIRVFSELIMMSFFCIKIKQSRYIIYYFIFTLVYVWIFLIFSLRGAIMKYKWKS
ncbi:glycosyltransferase [bacterium]|nr:glycosyltransferase [bacterium]